jgi:pentatricopeptide repeat protein
MYVSCRSYVHYCYCCCHVRWREALRELDIAQQTSVPLNVFIYGAAITAMSRSGRYAEGCGLLDKMLAAGLKANVITYNAAMSGCAKCGKWQEVSHMFACCNFTYCHH